MRWGFGELEIRFAFIIKISQYVYKLFSIHCLELSFKLEINMYNSIISNIFSMHSIRHIRYQIESFESIMLYLTPYTAKRQCKQGTYKCYFISNIEMLTYGKLLNIGREMYEYTL